MKNKINRMRGQSDQLAHKGFKFLKSNCTNSKIRRSILAPPVRENEKSATKLAELKGDNGLVKELEGMLG